MNKKDLLWILGLETVFLVNAGVVFTQLESRFAAALIAGCGFLFLGAFVVVKTKDWKDKYRSLTFYMGHIHLWVGSIPQMVASLLIGGVFAERLIVGIPAPTYHRISEVIYLLLILGTLVDLNRLLFRKSETKKPQPPV